MGSVRGHPLLVEHLLTDVRESDPSMPARYDAERGYSVTPTGDRSWKASCRERPGHQVRFKPSGMTQTKI